MLVLSVSDMKKTPDKNVDSPARTRPLSFCVHFTRRAGGPVTHSKSLSEGLRRS
jgi:hypothetical protein